MDLTKPQASLTFTTTMTPWVRTVKTRDRNFIHLSEEPEQTALDQSKNITTNPDSVQA